MKINIMVLVGSNGKAAACIQGQLGWGDLADNIMDWEGRNSTDPDATSRHIVSVEIPVPTIQQMVGEAREV
jgi:hypothetical protein